MFKLLLLGLLALFSLYRLHENYDFLTLCATAIVVAAFRFPVSIYGEEGRRGAAP